MKVWVLEKSYEYDGSAVEEVFSSLEAAEAYEEANPEPDDGDWSWRVYEFTLKS